MIQLIYVSHATESFSAQALEALLTAARGNNIALNVTGMLLHQEGAFLQMLEGDAPAVDSLYAKICGDRRHDRQLLLSRSETEMRSFPDWSMGFTDVRGSAQRLVGFRRIGDLIGLSGDMRVVETVVRSFREGRWKRAA